MEISNPVGHITGIGPALETKLSKLEIHSIFDLLYHIPFRYEDRSRISAIREIQPGETVVVIGTLDSLKNQFTGKGRLVQKGVVTDNTGSLDLIWFNQTFLTRTLSTGTKVALYGKVEFFGKSKALISPDYEIFSENLNHMGRIVPIYPETSGLTSKWFRNTLKKIIPSLTMGIPDLLPNQLTWTKAIQDIHFPKNFSDIEPAKNRLAADEILLLQLAGHARKKAWNQNKLTHSFKIDTAEVKKFTSKLPFNLTATQSNAISEIFSDLAKSTPMNRLLEGDVGSGKTVVAAIASFVTAENNLQTIFLAPTQILAQQHFQTLTKLFAPLNIEIGLITGSSKLRAENSKLKIVVGTHALLNDNLNLKNVGLVIIDEQHRFGVLQRSLASLKGESPHILTMTATPIPRTLALAIHGDLEVSYLDAPPTGRLPIKTWVVPENKRDSGYAWILTETQKNKSQAYIVCPFIEPSETNTTVKAVTIEFEKLKSIFGPLKLGLLHGKLKNSEKDEVMSDFKAGKIDILVATPVVEVGLDVPNANIMLIEAADRFGLSQLHQLRGRVGRGSLQSYCLLFADNTNSARLKSLETHNSGRELAEIDFRLRGPGHIYGTAQHGQVQFKIATYENTGLISSVKKIADQVFPQLKNYPLLLKLIENDKISLIQPN